MQISQVSAIAYSIVGAGTEHARSEMVSPRNILEHIINIFTFGGLKHGRSKQYDEFAKALATRLNETLQAEPPKWNIEGSFDLKLSGYTVTFEVPKEGDDVSIEVKDTHGSVCEYTYVSRERFSRTCTLLLLQERNPFAGIPQSLADDGILDLSGVNLNFSVLCGIDLQGANLANATFNNAKLNHANLSNANLSKASLKGANLDYTRLTDANLDDADLRYVKRNHLPAEEVRRAHDYVAQEAVETSMSASLKKPVPLPRRALTL